MKKMFVAVAALTAAATLGAAAAVQSQAASAAPSQPTRTAVKALTPDQVAALQNPLIATATPLSNVGSTKMASIYSSVSLDTAHHAVILYVTDTSKAGQLLQAARSSSPGVNLSLVRVVKSSYSMATLYAAADRIIAASIAGRTPFKVYSAAQAGNGAGLQLSVANPAGDKALTGRSSAALKGQSMHQLAGVPLTFTQGTAVTGADRENDTAPFIGGDYATGWNTPDKRRPYCTTGIPIEGTSNQDGLIEAGHCFTPDNGVYTENGSTYMGVASAHVDDSSDAEIIWNGTFNGAGSNADEGEADTGVNGIAYHPLVDTVGYAAGEDVCQDGINSYFRNRGVPCNLQIQGYDTYALCPLADGYCGPINGVRATSNNGNPVSSMGDSGAVVFTIHSAGSRNALGMIDGEPTGCDPNCTTVYFILASSIYSYFGIHLNPHQ